jgi:hypothetical protein
MPLFSPDGRWLATTPDGGQLWSVGDWKPGASLRALGTTPSGLELAFSPDSSVLAVSQPQGTTRLVDPLSGADWAELLRSDPRRSSDLCFSPDQSLLIEMPFGDRSEPRVWRFTYWNTLGAALYRDAQYSEAVLKLEESLRRGGEPTAGFDLIFLALCHQALGNRELARQNLAEATAWFESRRMKLSSAWLEELTVFLNEANAKLPVASGRD